MKFLYLSKVEFRIIASLFIILLHTSTIFSQEKVDVDLMVYIKDVNFINSKKNYTITYWIDNGVRLNKMEFPKPSYIGLVKYIESQGYELQDITEGTSGLINIQTIGTKFWFKKLKNTNSKNENHNKE